MGTGQLNTNYEAVRARKQILRRQLRASRAALSVAQRADAANLLGTRLRQLLTNLKLAQDDLVAVFLATRQEVWLDGVITSLLEHGQCVVAPIDAKMDAAPFFTLSSITEGTRLGAWGVREPVQHHDGKVFWPHEIKANVVPGLAFDRQGGRLGYGGGWYDRVLGQIPVSIGVCYDCQLVAQVPCEAHDQRVAFVVTETQTIKVARS